MAERLFFLSFKNDLIGIKNHRTVQKMKLKQADQYDTAG